MTEPKVISVQSFRQGTGRSTLTVNIAAWMVENGYRVGLVDADFYSPSLHIFLSSHVRIQRTLNDYLWGICEIGQAVYAVQDVSPAAQENLFFLPASGKPQDIMRMLRDTYHTNLLAAGLQAFTKTFDLDVLLIDNHAGLSDDALLMMAISDVVLVMMRPDAQHYDGTNLMLTIAKKLQVPRTMLAVNELSNVFSPETVQREVTTAFGCEVAAVLPHSAPMAALGSEKIISWQAPEQPIALLYKDLALRLLQNG